VPVDVIYCEMDLRYLVPLLRGEKSLEDERFRKLYTDARDIWARAFPNGAMPSARLQLLVEEYERINAREARASVDPVIVQSNGKKSPSKKVPA
jgi:hypothetical protein